MSHAHTHIRSHTKPGSVHSPAPDVAAPTANVMSPALPTVVAPVDSAMEPEAPFGPAFCVRMITLPDVVCVDVPATMVTEPPVSVPPSPARSSKSPPLPAPLPAYAVNEPPL